MKELLNGVLIAYGNKYFLEGLFYEKRRKQIRYLLKSC